MVNKKMVSKIIYPIIDFSKEAMTEADAAIFYSDTTELKTFNVETLEQLLKEYVRKKQELELKIHDSFIQKAKTKEVLTFFSQHEQIELRSKYWFIDKSIKRLKKLIELNQVMEYEL